MCFVPQFTSLCPNQLHSLIFAWRCIKCLFLITWTNMALHGSILLHKMDLWLYYYNTIYYMIMMMINSLLFSLQALNPDRVRHLLLQTFCEDSRTNARSARAASLLLALESPSVCRSSTRINVSGAISRIPRFHFLWYGFHSIHVVIVSGNPNLL